MRKAAAMTEQEKQRQIDALVERIDAFHEKRRAAACASRLAARAKSSGDHAAPPAAAKARPKPAHAPAKRAGHKSR